MTISPSSVAASIERYARTTFDVPANDPEFSRDVHLFDKGYVDSVGFAELLAFIESTFGVTLESEDLFADDFTTINGMSGVIARRAGWTAAGAGEPSMIAREM